MRSGKKSKAKILFVCPHPENTAPGQRLKYEQYFTYFRANGVDLTIAPFMTFPFWKIVYKKGFLVQKVYWTMYGYLKRILLLFSLKKYDCVYVFLWVTPFGSTLFEWLTIKLSKKLIYDIDDLVYLKPASKVNPFLKLIKSGRKPIILMKHAHHVITCTPHLDAFVKKYTPNTTDISSTINTDTYQPANDYSNERKLTLGWSGSFSTSKYLKLLQNVLLKLKSNYDFDLLVIGDASFSIKGLSVEAIPWSAETEVKTLQRIDIGLYPLPNEEWVMGKSGLKALQYMALGIPTVATKIGANHRVIKDGESGFLVESDEEWLAKISLLLNNADLRKKIGEKARKRVDEHYSINANKNTYLQIINQTINN
ncbi:MAG: glycosyltransferase family 4 protein [Ekhidna sp.]